MNLQGYAHIAYLCHPQRFSGGCGSAETFTSKWQLDESNACRTSWVVSPVYCSPPVPKRRIRISKCMERGGLATAKKQVEWYARMEMECIYA